MFQHHGAEGNSGDWGGEGVLGANRSPLRSRLDSLLSSAANCAVSQFVNVMKQQRYTVVRRVELADDLETRKKYVLSRLTISGGAPSR